MQTPTAGRRLGAGVTRPAAVTITVDGEPVAAPPGESVAAALLAAGRRSFGRTRSGAPRGPFCNMGVCFECAVTVDGEPGVRACMAAVRAGMAIETEARDGAR
jgi:aerobic-type carbon monoxide dehydrogenase small subunit (CoxS/CutS family)